MKLSDKVEAFLRQRGHRWDGVEPLAGDVSRRRYLRLHRGDGAPRVLALYPEDLREACRRFERTTELLTGAGVRVPRILDSDCSAGWMLLEDLGPESLYERYRDGVDRWQDLRPWYLAAGEIAGRIAALAGGERAAVADLNPPLGADLLGRELDLTWESFLEPAGLHRERGAGQRLHRVLREVCRSLGAEPPVPCHRDFMVRNLVPLAASGTGAAGGTGLPGSLSGDLAPSLGVLDHQDLRLGPPFYDLASLLNDSLFPPATLEGEVLQEGLSAVQQTLGIPSPAGEMSYRRTAVQRTLKAVGTFARHGRHGALIRPTLRRALFHLESLPEAAPVLADLPALVRRFDLEGAGPSGT